MDYAVIGGKKYALSEIKKTDTKKKTGQEGKKPQATKTSVAKPKGR